MVLCDSLKATLRLACGELLAARTDERDWTGGMSSSALATASAVCALAVLQRRTPTAGWRTEALVWQGLEWLTENANPDGAWGDTILSPSNLSTTIAAWAVYGVVPGGDDRYRATTARAREWIEKQLGPLSPDRLAGGLAARGGRDRLASVPILAMCAVSGRLGAGSAAWRYVPPLPFEHGAVSGLVRALLRWKAPRHALPLQAAVGQARFHQRPPRNPLRRLLRYGLRGRACARLAELQATGGAFLESIPLTSFVIMGLAAGGREHEKVIEPAVEFLIRSVQSDGSWPVAAGLATRVTALAINALAAGGGPDGAPYSWTASQRQGLIDWLLARQSGGGSRTSDEPGGWSWTGSGSGLPNAEDTAAVLLALRSLGQPDERVRAAAESGVRWLLAAQRGDGGIQGFQGDWGQPPFDEAGPDLTAQALDAWWAWRAALAGTLDRQLGAACGKAQRYLVHRQSSDGSWPALWMGNPHAAAEANPTFGTARVVSALSGVDAADYASVELPLQRGALWLQRTQRFDGAWSGSEVGPASIEETAVATEGLAAFAGCRSASASARTAARRAMHRGTRWLQNMVRNGAWHEPSPIGLHLARVWYYERLYPLGFTVRALGRALQAMQEFPG